MGDFLIERRVGFDLGSGANKEMTEYVHLLPAAQFHYLDEGVSAVGRLFRAQGFGDPLSVGHEAAVGQTGGQDRLLHLHRADRD